MAKSRLEVERFIEALDDAGFEPKRYSGRGMYGKECVSVRGDEDNPISAWDIARELFGEPREFVIPEPRQDSLGLGIVLYWTSYEWPKEEENA